MLQICFASNNSIIIVRVNSLLVFRYFGWLRLCTKFSLITINYRFTNGRNLQVQIIQSNIHPGVYSQSRLIRKPMTKRETYAFSWDVLWLPMLSSPLLSWETMWLIHWDKEKLSTISHMTFQNVFFVWKLLYIHSNYIELYMQGFNQQ